MSAPPFLFQSEDRNTVFYHNIKVFIFGADVTPWLTSQVTVSYADRNGINRCSFTLSNAYRAFDLTSENLTNKKFRSGKPYAPDGKYSEEAKFTIYTLKVESQTNTKHQVKSFGGVKSNIDSGGTINEGEIRDSAKAEEATTTRYPMNPGSLVFHKYDPVRVFIQNPLTRDTNQWVCIFTGYLDTKPYSQNYVDGQSMINVSCQDIRVLMQNMRTASNPAVQTGNQNTLFFGGKPGQSRQDTGDAGFFNDLISPQNSISHVLAGLSFKQTVNFLLFGVPRPDNKGADSGVTGRVGALVKTDPLTYNPADKEDKRRQTLEKWNNLITFGDTEKFLTEHHMLKIGAATFHDGSIEVNGYKYGSPDIASVRFLYPSSGAPPSNLVEGQFGDAGVDAKVEMVSRLELLVNICKSIDYQMYVSGQGDIIFEFPMYDFLPGHYNTTYSKLYTFDKHIVSDNIDDEGGSPVTALEISSRNLRSELADHPANAGAVQGHAPANELRRTIFSNVLASRVGVHVETVFIPGVIEPNRLAQLGLIEFNKRLANFSKFDLTCSYRPFIGVNRPIYHVNKYRMGITETVNYTWRIREEATVDFALNYPRKLEDRGDGKFSFRFITGGEGTPISYSTVYQHAFATGQAVNATVDNQSGPPKAANNTGLSNQTGTMPGPQGKK